MCDGYEVYVLKFDKLYNISINGLGNICDQNVLSIDAHLKGKWKTHFKFLLKPLQTTRTVPRKNSKT